MIQSGIVISDGASKDIAALATGQDRKVVALAALREAIEKGTLTSDDRLALVELAGKAEKLQIPSTFPTLESTPSEYPDRRSGFAPHKAIDFKATPTEISSI